MSNPAVFATVSDLAYEQSVLYRSEQNILEVRRAADYSGIVWVTVNQPTVSAMTCIECISGECVEDHKEYDIHLHWVRKTGYARYELVYELRNPVTGFTMTDPVNTRMSFESAREWIAEYVSKFIERRN